MHKIKESQIVKVEVFESEAKLYPNHVSVPCAVVITLNQSEVQVCEYSLIEF